MANHRFGGNQGDPDAVFDGAQQVPDGVGFEDAPPIEARFLAGDVDPCAKRRVGAILSELTVSKVTQANSSEAGERVAMVDGEHERLRDQGPLVQVGSLEGTIDYCDVEVSGNHAVDKTRYRVVMDAQADFRMVFVEIREPSRQRDAAERLNSPDAEPTPKHTAYSGYRILPVTGSLERSAGRGQECAACLGELDLTAGTNQQFGTEFAFQRGDRTGQTRLRQVHLRRGAREVPFVGHGDEVLQLPKLHESMVPMISIEPIRWTD
ncbi:hypothetical protein GCM10009823_04880 [Brevibacterium salitolerans]|uniref:Uncharacterized protein n=1 Tax=Brevibacterium salitolerans TaxID=1403566 RepID=A0ABN2WDJ7_9MICO